MQQVFALGSILETEFGAINPKNWARGGLPTTIFDMKPVPSWLPNTTHIVAFGPSDNSAGGQSFFFFCKKKILHFRDEIEKVQPSASVTHPERRGNR